jgi:hypothetical protein
LSHCYVFNLFNLSGYFWLHFLLYSLSWPQAASLPRTPSILDETIHRALLAGTLFFFSTKVGFRANISILVKLQP